MYLFIFPGAQKSLETKERAEREEESWLEFDFNGAKMWVGDVQLAATLAAENVHNLKVSRMKNPLLMPRLRVHSMSIIDLNLSAVNVSELTLREISSPGKNNAEQLEFVGCVIVYTGLSITLHVDNLCRL